MSVLGYSFIQQWVYSPLLVPGLFFSFVIIFTKSVGLLGRVISPSQGRYLHTGQHKHRIHAYRHLCLQWESYPRSSLRASEDTSCFRPRGHCGRRFGISGRLITVKYHKVAEVNHIQNRCSLQGLKPCNPETC
jgi:hypothetical protein